MPLVEDDELVKTNRPHDVRNGTCINLRSVGAMARHTSFSSRSNSSPS